MRVALRYGATVPVVLVVSVASALVAACGGSLHEARELALAEWLGDTQDPSHTRAAMAAARLLEPGDEALALRKIGLSFALDAARSEAKIPEATGVPHYPLENFLLQMGWAIPPH